jgi:hypothetical protein
MKTQVIDLMPDEYQALLAIIRHAFRAHTDESSVDVSRTDWYQSNPRMCLRLLEVLNPKGASHAGNAMQIQTHQYQDIALELIR